VLVVVVAKENILVKVSSLRKSNYLLWVVVVVLVVVVAIQETLMNMHDLIEVTYFELSLSCW
jgi:hypothetical protein